MATILVIDDDLVIRRLFEHILSRKGHEVILAENGQQGLKMINETELQLIITDIMMPGMGGMELLLELKKQGRTVPVIAISGGLRDLPLEFMKQAEVFGACQVLEKPIRKEILEKAIGEALAGAA
jgi:DNA-binding NtrC family response regulator